MSTPHLPRTARLQPVRALRAVRRLLKNPEETEHVFEILDALRGRSSERGFRKLNRLRPDLVAEQPEMLAFLSDRTALAELPAGSLGREYLAFCEREGITADGLVEASDAIRTRRGGGGGGGDVEWFERRGRDSHDLWHVVTGYGTNTLGEVCVVTFTAAQTGNLGLAVIAFFGTLRHAREIGLRNSFGPTLEAFLSGRRAAWLPGMDWRTFVAMPLNEVRTRLAIPQPRSYGASLEQLVAQPA